MQSWTHALRKEKIEVAVAAHYYYERVQLTAAGPLMHELDPTDALTRSHLTEASLHSR